MNKSPRCKQTTMPDIHQCHLDMSTAQPQNAIVSSLLRRDRLLPCQSDEAMAVLLMLSKSRYITSMLMSGYWSCAPLTATDCWDRKSFPGSLVSTGVLQNEPWETKEDNGTFDSILSAPNSVHPCCLKNCRPRWLPPSRAICDIVSFPWFRKIKLAAAFRMHGGAEGYPALYVTKLQVPVATCNVTCNAMQSQVASLIELRSVSEAPTTSV